MLTAKYSPLAQSDSEDQSSAIQFTSAFSFHESQHGRKYRSAFTYNGYNPSNGIHTVVGELCADQLVVFACLFT